MRYTMHPDDAQAMRMDTWTLGEAIKSLQSQLDTMSQEDAEGPQGTRLFERQQAYDCEYEVRTGKGYYETHA